MGETFGEKLRDLRKENNIGQIQLAKQLDVSQSIISIWELDRCEPTLSNLVKIAEFFGVSIDYLAGIEK